MSIIAEYTIEKTKIRIHDDYLKEGDKNKAKEMIISLMLENLQNENYYEDGKFVLK